MEKRSLGMRQLLAWDHVKKRTATNQGDGRHGASTASQQINIRSWLPSNGAGKTITTMRNRGERATKDLVADRSRAGGERAPRRTVGRNCVLFTGEDVKRWQNFNHAISISAFACRVFSHLRGQVAARLKI